MKAIELIGEPLEWAAATCEGFTLTTDGISMLLERGKELRLLGPHSSPLSYSPSTNWAQGGPIVESEIEELQRESNGKFWAATSTHSASGPTPLVAAMRCYVASKLGEEIAVPKELLARAAARASAIDQGPELLAAAASDDDADESTPAFSQPRG